MPSIGNSDHIVNAIICVCSEGKQSEDEIDEETPNETVVDEAEYLIRFFELYRIKE